MGQIYTITKQSAVYNNDLVLIVGESLFCFTKCTLRRFIPAKQKAIFMHNSPRRMFLFCARIIKIKSWAVSCAKRRIGCGRRRLTFVCPGLGTARCAHAVYFYLLTIQTPLKGPMHGCSHFSQKGKTRPYLLLHDPHLATCIPPFA